MATLKSPDHYFRGLWDDMFTVPGEPGYNRENIATVAFRDCQNDALRACIETCQQYQDEMNAKGDTARATAACDLAVRFLELETKPEPELEEECGCRNVECDLCFPVS